MKIEIFNPEDDGYQIIYINNVFYEAIHFNDDQLSYTAKRLLLAIGQDFEWSDHEDIPNEYKEFLVENGYIDD